MPYEEEGESLDERLNKIGKTNDLVYRGPFPAPSFKQSLDKWAETERAATSKKDDRSLWDKMTPMSDKGVATLAAKKKKKVVK